MYRVLKLKEAEESEERNEKFDKCQAILPLDNYHSMGIIVSEDGETVQYMYSNGNDVYESDVEYDEEGNPFFKDENGEKWMISEFMRTNFGESEKLTEAEDDEEELEDEEKAEETEEDLEDTVDSEEDQEENPVEEESTLDQQLDEIRDVLVDLDLRLYKIMNNEEEFYIIGRLDPISNQVEMLVDTQPADTMNVNVEPDGSETAEQTLKDDEETNLPDKDIDIATRFDYIKLPVKFEQIKDMFPRYGEDLTPDHEAIMEYLMNLLIEQNPRAAKERAEEQEDNAEEIPIDDEIVAQEEIPGEEESEDED